MKAGRELDALVAYKVMGCERFIGCTCDCGNGRPIAPACGYFPDPKLGASPHSWQVPYFSTRIEHAWDVVDHLTHHEMKFMWTVMVIDDDRSVGISPTTEKYDNSNVSTGSYAVDAVPLGICVAALKACNVPLDEPIKPAMDALRIEVKP